MEMEWRNSAAQKSNVQPRDLAAQKQSAGEIVISAAESTSAAEFVDESW